MQEDQNDIMKIKKKYQINKKIILKKNREKKILQKQNKRCIEIRDLIRLYTELEIKLKAMEQNFKKMTQKTIKIFINEIFSKSLKRNYPTNKTDVYHIDDIWSLDILDLEDYGPENNRRYRYVLVIIDNFSKIGWTVPLKNESAQTITNSFKIFSISSEKKPKLIETDRGKEFYNSIFQDFLSENNIKIYPRNGSYGAVFAERFNRTIRDLLKRPVFEKGDGKWIDILPKLTKQYNKRSHLSTKLTLIQAILKN